jgi:hypothetical protein
MARAGSNVGEQVVSISFQFFKTGPDVLRHCLSWQLNCCVQIPKIIGRELTP